MNHLFILVTQPVCHRHTAIQLSQLLAPTPLAQAPEQTIEEVFFYQAGVRFCHPDNAPTWLTQADVVRTVCTTSLELHDMQHDHVHEQVKLSGMTSFLAAYAAKQRESQHQVQPTRAILLQPEFDCTTPPAHQDTQNGSVFTVEIKVSPKQDPLRYREALLMAMGATNVFNSVLVVLQQDATALLRHSWPEESVQAKLIKVLKGLFLYDVESVYFVVDEDSPESNINGLDADFIEPLSTAGYTDIISRSHTLLRF